MPGLHIFKASNGESMMILKTVRDKEWDLVQIAERFEVPYMEIKTHQQGIVYYSMIEATGRQVARDAISKYERLRHWRWYTDDKHKPQLDQSEIQYDLDRFRSSVPMNAVDQGSIIDDTGMVAYVIKLWFIQPKILVETIIDEPTDPDTIDGFVNAHNMEAFHPIRGKLA